MKQSIEHIYAEHGGMVFNLCLNYTQHRQEAEELTQDVFVKVYQKLEGFSGKSSLRTWIYRITINQCLDHVKAKNRKKRFGLMVPLVGSKGQVDPRLTQFDHPGVLMEDKEDLSQLFAQINALPPKQKTALILKALDGLSQKEIAEIMEVTVKSVESLLSRAKSGLKALRSKSEGKTENDRLKE